MEYCQQILKQTVTYFFRAVFEVERVVTKNH